MMPELRLERADDVFNLRADEKTRELDLGAAVWVTEGETPKQVHRRSMSHAASLVSTKLDGYLLWLLGAHTAWQPTTRIVRHRKLWSSLEARGLEVPVGREVGEECVESKEGIRFFAALQLGSGALDSTVAILEAEPACHLVALPHSAEVVVGPLTRAGWNRADFGPSSEVLAAVCRPDGVVLWPLGAFDDRESGCAAFARRRVLEDLLR